MTNPTARVNFLPTALIILALVVLAFFLDALIVELLAFLLGVVLAIVLYPVMRFLRDRTGMPHMLAVGVTVLLFLALTFGTLVVVAPAVAREAQNFQQILQQLRENPQQVEFINQIPGLSRIVTEERVQSLVQQMTAAPSAVTGRAFDFTTRVLESLAYIFFAILTLVFVLGGARSLVHGVLQITPDHLRDPMARTFSRIIHDLGVWGLWVIVIAIITAILSWLGFMLVGIQSAVLFGVIQGIGELIPDVGPFLAGVTVVAALLVTNPTQALWALLIVLVIQTSMSFIEPIIFGRTIRVHPMWTVLGILLLGSAYGAIGALLAVPIFAIIKIAVEEFYASRLPKVDRDRLNAVLSGRAARRRRER